MESNAPEALLCKDSGKRSEDFCAAERRKSNGILRSGRSTPVCPAVLLLRKTAQSAMMQGENGGIVMPTFVIACTDLRYVRTFEGREAL